MSPRHILFHLILTLFLNFFFFQEIRGFGSAVLLIGLQIFLISYFWTHAKTMWRSLAVASTAVLYFAILLSLRSSAVAQSLLFLGGSATVLATFYLLTLKQAHFQSLAELALFIPRTVISYFKSAKPSFIEQVAQHQSQALGETKPFATKINSIVIGLALSAPVLLILISLLSGADPIFGSSVQQFFKDSSLQTTAQHILLSLVILVALIPATGIRYPQFKDPGKSLREKQFATEFSVVQTLVALVLAFFVIIQWQYIFIPSVRGVDLSQFGFSTYSEYVQRGFTEFIFVSVLLFALLWLGLIFLQSARHRLLFILQLIVVSEFFVLLASFFRRIWLYQDYHGMTLIRFYGGFLMVALSFFLLTLLARHFRNFHWVRIEAVAALFLLALVGSINVEGYIATHPPTVNERIDITYLSRLSADGIEGWNRALETVQTTQDNLELKVATDTKLSPKDRQDLAYAGLALYQVSTHYSQLSRQYASQELWVAEQRRLSEFAIAQLDRAIATIEDQITTIQIQLPETLLSGANTAEDESDEERARVLSDQTRIAYQKQIDLQSDRNVLLEIRSTLEKQEYSVAMMESSLPFLSGNINQYFSSDVACSLGVNCTSASSLAYPHVHRSFYLYLPIDLVELSTRAKLLRFTVTEQHAFAKLQEQQLLEKLLTLQEQHFTLYTGITTLQTSDATAFETDISLNTPLLPELR